MTILYVGIDLAKTIFAVHAINEAGKPELVRPNVARAKLLELIVSLPPCVIGMEACSGAHHWARQFMAHGHTVRRMAPKFVSPYRPSGKRGARMTPPTRPRSAKPCNDRACASSRSKAWNSNRN